MHNYGDSYHRIQVHGDHDLALVGGDELKKSAVALFGAIAFREKYLALSLQPLNRKAHLHTKEFNQHFKVTEDDKLYLRTREHPY